MSLVMQPVLVCMWIVYMKGQIRRHLCTTLYWAHTLWHQHQKIWLVF